MKRAEGARIDEVFDPFPYRHLPAFVDLLHGNPDVFDTLDLFVDLFHYLFGLRRAFLHPFYLCRTKRFSKIIHLFKIRSHYDLL